MPAGGPRSIGELLTSFILVLNIIFVVVMLFVDTHCQEQIEGYDALTAANKDIADRAQCEDIFFFTNDVSHSEADGIKDLSHTNGRFALLLTTVSLGLYVVTFIRQVERFRSSTQRVYDNTNNMPLVTAALTWIMSLVAWALIISEGANLNEISDGATPVAGKLEYTASTGWYFLLMIWLFNSFIFLRTAVLRFKSDSWPQKIGSKGSFGAGGSARIAEQFPVMGGGSA